MLCAPYINTGCEKGSRCLGAGAETGIVKRVARVLTISAKSTLIGSSSTQRTKLFMLSAPSLHTGCLH